MLVETGTLIVGGGLAGLRLAGILQEQGQDFLLAEARERTGGRILSVPIGDGVCDLGPAWFWPGQPRIVDLAADLGLTVFEQYSRGNLVLETREGAVRRDLAMAPMAGSLRLAEGLGALADGLAKAVSSERMRLNAVLTRLERSEDGVLAHFAGSSGPAVRARRVVLALPPRLVAANVVFDPDLPDTVLQAMRAVPTWMAGHAKLIAFYPRPFWRDAGLSGDAISHRGPLAEIHDASIPGIPEGALFGFLGVPPAARRALGRELEAAAIRQLTVLFGAEAARPSAVRLQDWATDPFTATPADEDASDGHPAYGLPPHLRGLWDGCLMLASTETGRDFGGFLEGALEAAETTAQEILARRDVGSFGERSG